MVSWRNNKNSAICLRTDAEALQREAEAIKIDGLNVAQMNELRDKVSSNFLQIIL